MRASLEFAIGLLARADPAFASFEDVRGPHGPALALWQRYGFLSAEPEPALVPSCPHCCEGVPLSVGGRLLCGRCAAGIDPRHLSAWRFDVAALLGWLARDMRLGGGVRRVDGELWQLGSLPEGDGVAECFYCRRLPTERGAARLAAYRDAVLLRPLPTADALDGFRGRSHSLLDVLTMTADTISVAGFRKDLGTDCAVRFDGASGGLWAGDTWLGEVPLGSKEYFLVACLAENLDRFVAYADLKHEVSRRSGSRDGTDEATFCHKLKRRIKEKGVAAIDRLIATTNKGDGYRLRGHLPS